MSENNKKLTKLLEFFTTPEKIINYAKEHWSFLKYSLIVLIAGVLMAINFFWSNFRLEITSGLLPLIPLLLLLGWILLAFFLLEYLLMIWGATRIYLLIANKRKGRVSNTEEVNSNDNRITKKNLWSKLKVISYCYVIPFLVLQIVLIGSMLFFYSIDALYILAFLRDFGTLFTYVWIIPLTLYSIKDVAKSQKYKMNVIILASLLLAYYLHYLFILQGTQYIAILIQNIA